MTDKKIEPGYPVDGGAGKKLDYLANQVSSTQLENSGEARSIEVRLKVEVGPNGKTCAAGFSIACD